MNTDKQILFDFLENILNKLQSQDLTDYELYKLKEFYVNFNINDLENKQDDDDLIHCLFLGHFINNMMYNKK